MCETEGLLCICYEGTRFKMGRSHVVRAGIYLQMLNPVLMCFQLVCIKVSGLINANDL